MLTNHGKVGGAFSHSISAGIANEVFDGEVWVPLKNKRVLVKVGFDPAYSNSEGFGSD